MHKVKLIALTVTQQPRKLIFLIVSSYAKVPAHCIRFAIVNLKLFLMRRPSDDFKVCTQQIFIVAQKLLCININPDQTVKI